MLIINFTTRCLIDRASHQLTLSNERLNEEVY